MSGLYVYALATEPPAAPPGTGLAGEALQSIACGPLYALVGPLDDRPALDPAALAGHDAAVRRLAEALPALLPVRFGEWAPNAPTLVERLAPRTAELADALALVRGCVQMTLRVFGSPEAPGPGSKEVVKVPAECSADSTDPADGPGTRYLAARRRALRQAHEVPEIADLRASLLPLLRAERTRRHAGGPLLATVCHLIERSRLPTYQEKLAEESRRTAVRSGERALAALRLRTGRGGLKVPADPPDPPVPPEMLPPKVPADCQERLEAGPASDRLRLEIAEVEALRDELERRVSAEAPRWNADPEEVQRSVARLVLTLVEFLRRLMERQAIRRMEADTLTAEEVEALGVALMRLEETVHDMAGRFGLEPADLNLDLGPLGRLL